jgi:hypothetical protein
VIISHKIGVNLISSSNQYKQTHIRDIVTLCKFESDGKNIKPDKIKTEKPQNISQTSNYITQNFLNVQKSDQSRFR